ncbi:MAG: VCBS repeat-containing protein [Flavobacteriaceae bacterium]|nr:VCBS repeat-containing protein [Flavobacteriaceae bacterium]
MKYFLGVFIITTIALTGCSKKDSFKTKAAIYFENVSDKHSNINFTNTLIHQDDLNIIEYLYYYNGGGVAVGDINNDGLEDIYLTANQTSDRLYLNLGDLKFKDITEEAGIQTDSTWSTGVTMDDVNNDGLMDIYVSKVGNYKGLQAHNLLYLNNGNNRFTESSAAAGIDFSGFSTQASFFDYDKDGDLDMYLLNHAVHTPRSYGDTRIRYAKDSLAGDILFENKLNEGQLKFADVTDESGIYSSALGYGLALITSDVNDDGLIDIYVGNDFHENDYLYINQGDKTFTESNADYLNHTTRFTMGVDVGDLNNDQRSDIFSLDMMPYDKEIFLKSGGEDSDKVSQIKKNFGFENQYARNTFQLNNDNTSFSDVALLTNTYATDWSWSVLIQDFDNDGLNDLYITNGIYKRPNDLNYINYLSNINFSKYSQTNQNKIERQLIDEMPTINLSNVLFHNKGNLEFERYSEQSGLTPSYSNGSAYSDLDNDGDLDIVVNNINEKAFLLENKSSETTPNNFVSFSLIGNDQYPSPNGAKLFVYANGEKQYKELTPTRGFQSSSTHRLHFGIGNIEKIDSVQVHWLDGTFQTEKDLAINQHFEIIKNSNLPGSQNIEVDNTSQKTENFPFVHLENNYLDYEYESLMPEKLSTEGPAVVQADFNMDGLTDIYIGAAKYQAPSFYIQQKNGGYLKDKTSDFNKETIYEDVDALSFDYDNDGDLDLYVMSGGNEKPEGDTQLEDRFYINDGKAKFTRLELSLIRTNGGSVSSADFDGDGLDDLFIGNRSIPGAYGISPESFILKNNLDKGFVIVEKQKFGMVTDSKWVDLNNDDLLDLVVVGDWMPVTVLINTGNLKFENKTKEFGLENTEGLWNVVTTADIDKNGYQDIILGNAGLNLKWKASVERPIKLFLHDFDENQQLDPIIFYDFFGEYVPFASKDKLVGQLPSLKKKFLNYEKFAKIKSIKDLTGVNEDDILVSKKISELRSMIYLNSGSELKGTPMIQEAQMSSIEDIYIEQDEELTNIFFVGNYLGYTTELGESASNSGGVISIDEKGDQISYKQLPTPTNLNSRKVLKLDKNRVLVIANNDKSYIFDKPKTNN